MTHVKRTTDRDDYETPPLLALKLNGVFRFTHDMAATKDNAILNCQHFDDSLNGQSWGLGGSLWCNPPFSNKDAFFERGIEARNLNRVTVFLVPNNARESLWWQRYALQADEVINLTPRVNFCLGGKECKGVAFPSCLLVYYPRLEGIVTSPREVYWKWK